MGDNHSIIDFYHAGYAELLWKISDIYDKKFYKIYGVRQNRNEIIINPYEHRKASVEINIRYFRPATKEQFEKQQLMYELAK